MAMITQKDLQELVDFQSEDPPVVSLYLVVGPTAGTKEAHRAALRGLLKEASSGASSKDIEAIEKYFDFEYDWQARAVAVFSCADKGFWRDFQLDVPVHNKVSVGRRAYVKPLTRLLDAFSRYGVILVDREGARLFQFEMGRLREAAGTLGDEVKRHKQGGFAAARYQRRADEQAAQNLRRAAELANDFFQGVKGSRLIIGGTAETVSQFQGMLPKALQQRVVGTLPLDILAPAGEVRDRTMELIQEVNRVREAELVEKMITAATKGGAAAIGLADTLMALQEHRVHILIVAEEYESPGYRCQECNYVSADFTPQCPFCSGSMEEVEDAVDTAIRRAIDQGIEVEIVPGNEDLEKAGSIGAILRY